jgi:hypothetical protein
MSTTRPGAGTTMKYFVCAETAKAVDASKAAIRVFGSMRVALNVNKLDKSSFQ